MLDFRCAEVRLTQRARPGARQGKKTRQRRRSQSHATTARKTNRNQAPHGRAESPLGSVRGRGKLVVGLLHLFGTFLAPGPTPADILLDEGEDLASFGLDAVVVHTPGHTPCSSSLLVEKRLALVGDLLSTRGQPHVQRFYATDWSLIQASLTRIQALKPEWVYTGHGSRPMSGKVLQELRCDRV